MRWQHRRALDLIKAIFVSCVTTAALGAFVWGGWFVLKKYNLFGARSILGEKRFFWGAIAFYGLAMLAGFISNISKVMQRDQSYYEDPD